MNIAIIVRKLNVRGGVQRHAISLARELAKKGHVATLYTFLYDKEKCYADLLEGCGVVSLGRYPGHANFLFDIIAQNRAAKRLALKIDAHTDIVNAHDHVCYKVAVYFKKYVGTAPSVWTMHDMPTRSFGYARARELDSSFKKGFMARCAYALVDWYESRFIRLQDAIAVLDRRDKALARRFFGAYALIVRNGLDVEKFPYGARAPLTRKKAKLMMGGVFFAHRRFEDGIEAVKILRDQGYDVTLTIIGNHAADQGYYRRLAALADARGIREQVVFTGEIPEAELGAAYRACDIFLFPNHLQSWGLAVFEAMASGTTVIVSRSAGASEVLTDGATALLVHPKSPEEIARAAARLIDDPVLYEKLSREARAFVEREISWARLADQMEGMFRTALQSRNTADAQSASL